MRIIVLGGTGNFGARIVRALCPDPNIELLAAGRRGASIGAPSGVPGVMLNVEAPDFSSRLKELSPQLVIHCVGPFQGQSYHIAKAALEAGAHYLDLADGREYVSGFSSGVNEAAVAAGKIAITGASTLPALSFAVVEHLGQGLEAIESIDVVIAPGQLAPRGEATFAGVFSYLGRDFPVLDGGRWRRTWGWMDLRAVRLDVGPRLSAACDVPDLTLFPTCFPQVKSVRFHAALEFRVQHLALFMLAGLRRMGIPLPVNRWGKHFNRLARLFDRYAGEQSGMSVSVVGTKNGRKVLRQWQLIAPALSGPEVPCMAAILLARRLARGDLMRTGAFPCMGFLPLSQFEPSFGEWQITTRTEERQMDP